MRTRSRLLLVAMGALVVFAMGVSSASARNLSISDQQFLAEWRELTFGEGTTIICPVTLKGSFHNNTIAKVANALVGFVTTVSVDEPACDSSAGSGEATVLQGTLPWHITYNSFAGTLPRLSGVELNLIGTAFEIYNLPFGISCLYEGNAEGTVNVEGGGTATVLRADETSEIPLQEGGFLCPDEGHFQGEAPVKAPDDDPITVTLI